MWRDSLKRFGGHPVGVWVVKHLVSPLDRLAVRLSGGRLRPPSSHLLPTLLLTTKGRHSGRERSVPLVYVREGDAYIVANARPSGERRNPWVLNLRAAGRARIEVGGRTLHVAAHEIDESEIDGIWPALVDAWPAFRMHYAATQERSVFALKPLANAGSTDPGDTPDH